MATAIRMIASTACAALLAAVLASQAAAFHIPGADYSGTVSGGGSITFSVSGDGSSVTNLTLTGVHLGDCSRSSASYTQPIPIAKQNFDNGEVSGSFPNVQGAYGHFNIPGFGFPSCRIKGYWSATTNASPSGSMECRKARARLRKIGRALKKAKRAGNEGKTRKLGRKWWRVRGKVDAVCG